MNRQMYNMGGPSRPRQMYDMGGSSLQAGAPDLRLTGVHPTYSQARKKRMNMAGGGIMGSNSGSMLVAPTADGSRPGYALADYIPGYDTIKKIGQTIMPGGDTGYFDLYGGEAYDTIKKIGQTIVPGGEEGFFDLYNIGGAEGAEQPEGSTPPYIPGDDPYKGGGIYDYGTEDEEDEDTGNPLYNTLKKIGQTIVPGGEEGYFDLYNTGGPDTTNMTPEQISQLEIEKYKRKLLNADVAKAIAAGTAAGAYADSQPKDKLAADNTGMDIAAIRAAAQGTDEQAKAAGLNFLPDQITRAANGGRIGYGEGTPDPKIPEKFLEDLKRRKLDEMLDQYYRFQEGYEKRKNMAPTQEAAMGGRIGYGDGGLTEYEVSRLKGLGYNTKGGTVLEPFGGIKVLRDILKVNKYAEGGRVPAQEGGLMDLGGNEMDLRAEGGFIPIGGKEKADDVPARLSRNEFVFTADAVRNAGGGNIDEGAQVMERLMKSLEQGGQVSEESQGLDGAREMFETSQRLEKRII